MMRRNCTNVIKFGSMAAKSAHISVMLNVRMELLEARFDARRKGTKPPTTSLAT